MASAAAAPHQPDAGGRGDRRHDAEVSAASSARWCPRHQVAGRVDWSRQASRTSSNEVEVVVISRTVLVSSATPLGLQRPAAAAGSGRCRQAWSTASCWVAGPTGGCPGPADLPDLVLGGSLGVVRGLVPGHAGVQHPPRTRGGCGHRSCAPPLTRPTCRGAGVTGGCQSPPAAAAQMPARGVPTTRPQQRPWELQLAA
jgi:hypothetical protein